MIIDSPGNLGCHIRELALKKVKQANLDIQLDLYEGNELPYQNDHFDKVVSCLVFHQLDMPQKKGALGEIYRVLKPGGEFHIGDWGKARIPVCVWPFCLSNCLTALQRHETTSKACYQISSPTLVFNERRKPAI